MPDMTFSNPQGQQITINSPDGSTPSEGELDQLFSQAHGSQDDSSEKPEQISDIRATQPQQDKSNNPNSTGNPITDISGDVARGFLNSGAGTVDKINGAVKLIKDVTSVDLNSEGLTNVSNKLKTLASQQPQSNNSIISGVGQFIGATPDALAEFAGSGGGFGFIARSAALSAADEYNKSQKASSLIKGAIVGGTVGAALNKVPDIIDGTAQMIKKWGATSGKTYIQAVTGATDKEAQDIINNINNMDINPKSKIQDYDEAKTIANSEIKTLKDNNSNLVDQQKTQYAKEYESSKISSDDAVNNLVETNRDNIDLLRTEQQQTKEDLANSTSADMMAATDLATHKLADLTSQTVANTAKAKSALEDTLVSTFDTASKKIQAMEKGVKDDVANAHASLDKNDLSFVQTPILQYEADSAIARGAGKFFKMARTSDGKGLFISPTAGTQTPAVSKGLELINSVRSHLVSDFLKTGKTSLAAIEANSDALEGAINKGFNGNSIPEKLAVVMADLKKSINPTKLFQKYPDELSHLKPLAEANMSYSSKIDNLRNALNLYKDNVDGAINPQKVFRALDKNDSSYIAKLKQADESLPKEDRIFEKVHKSYKDFKTVESSERESLTKSEKSIANQRANLSKKFDDMRKKLNAEQRDELVSKIKETRMNKREFTQSQRASLRDLHNKQQQVLGQLQAHKDKELSVLQDSVNSRLNSLHLLHMARGTRAAATGNARIFQNVANYRSIDGMTTMNPSKIVQGSIISKFASPSGASNTVKWALNADKELEGLKNISSNAILKKILATKLSGR